MYMKFRIRIQIVKQLNGYMKFQVFVKVPNYQQNLKTCLETILKEFQQFTTNQYWLLLTKSWMLKLIKMFVYTTYLLEQIPNGCNIDRYIYI